MTTCSIILPYLELLGDVLDDTAAALETAPPDELYKLDVALAAEQVRARMEELSRRLPQPLSAKEKADLRAFRELSGDREPAPGQRESWYDEVLARELSKEPGSRG